MLCLPLIRMLRSLKLTARAATLGALALGMLLASAAAATAAPDLVAEKITLNPKTAVLGATTFTMSLTIHNTGTTAAGAQITRIWASPDSQINGAGNDVLLFTLPVPALAAGQSVTFTSTTTPKIVIDPNRVGPTGTEYLPKNTYVIGVEVDAFNQVPGESNENNIFKSSDTLYVTVRQPVGPISYLPVNGTDLVSVARTLQWTTVTNANRYDVFFSRLKDTRQQFYPHSLLNITTPAQRIVLTDMKGGWYFNDPGYEPYLDPGLNSKGLPNNTPDILIAQNGTLSLYNRVYDDQIGNPRYWKPMVLFDGPYTTASTTRYYASRKFGPGIISALTAANMNFAYTADRGDGWSSHGSMDAVFATYMDGLLGISLGSVFVVMNKLDFYNDFKNPGGSFIPATDSITSTGDYMVMQLPNYRGPKVAGDHTYPMGIKSLVVADFDHDSDLDIMAGSDRYPGYTDDKIVIWQSDYRNSPNGDNDPWPYDFPVFTPRHITSVNSTLEDAQDMAVIDVDRDNLPDVVVASYHSDRLWLLYNKTKDDGGNRTTRTLDFDLVGPLPTDDTQTSSVFRGANTVCVRDLNNDRLPEIIAGAYFDGKIVIYENQSMGPGGITLAELVPHVLATGLPNLEKVTTEDINGDGLYDIIASSATNDMIVWYENKGNFQFVAHTVTQNANRVGNIVVSDMNNDLMPDIVSYSQYDNTLTWFADWPVLTSANLAGSNLIQPRYTPRQQMDFNTTYVWKVVSKAADVYSTNSDILTFRTQPTRININPIVVPVNPMEPNAGLALELSTIVDGPQDVRAYGIRAYADPILDRGFLLANVAVPPFYMPPNPVNYIGFYDFYRGYMAGQTGFQTPKFDYTTMPEGLYNLWIEALGETPDVHDGTRNGVFDGVPDGVDNWMPGNMLPLFTNSTYGDDVYPAQERLAVIKKPGDVLNPTPRDNAINVPTGVQFGWSPSTYATSYDVYMAGAASTLPQYTSMTVSNTLPNVQSIATGDLNNDGLPDVAASHVAGLNDARIYWMDSRSGGRAFGKNWVASGLLGAPLLKVADMDLDGKADILAGSSADSQIWWYRNKGGNPVVFDAPTVVGRNVAALNSIQAVDMDGDRDIDVLVASSVGNRLYYYERSGSSYIPRTIDASQGQALYARAADMDQDGDMDVVATFWNPNSVAWYENKGGTPPTFVRHVLSTAINNPRWLAIGDLDGDSDLDIAVASQVEGKIYQFLNNGAALPAFAASVAAQGLLGPHGLEIVDFNHDCRADLVTASATGNKLLYLMNGGGTPPAFIQYPIWSYPSTVTDLATGDMDRDNFGEVLGATSSGTINWFDYVVNYNFPMTLTRQNATNLPTNTYKPATLSPAMGYRWQVLAKRTVPIYGGTLERVTSSSLWTFFTGQSDLVAQNVTYTPAAVVQGDDVRFTVTEANSGFSDSAIHLAEIWASPDSIITRGGNDILLKRVYMGVVPAQSTVSVPSTVSTGAVGLTGKQELPEGNYYIGLFVDPTNQDKSESSKDNNKKVIMSPLLQILHRNNVGTWTDYR